MKFVVGKTGETREKPTQTLFCPLQSSHRTGSQQRDMSNKPLAPQGCLPIMRNY